MRIKKVINNNILCAVNEDGSEIIVTGRGIGFQRKVGERVDERLVEKVYRMEDRGRQRRLRELAAQIPLEHLELTEELVHYIRSQLDQPLNESLLITMADHISFAIRRRQEGIAFQDATLAAHMNGTLVPMNEVKDEAFASCVLGEGVAVEPSEGKLFAPADGVIDNVFDTRHAIGMTTDSGVELLLHVGIDTVKLNGQHFTAHVANDQKVKKGDLLLTFDMDAIKAAGYLLTTPMIVCNTDEYQSVKAIASGAVKAGQDVLQVKG